MKLRKEHATIRRIIDNWSYELRRHSNSNVFVAFEVCGKNIYLYSNRPGYLIGKAGVVIEKLREDLEQNGIKKKINFIEISDYYITEIRTKRKWL